MLVLSWYVTITVAEAHFPLSVWVRIYQVISTSVIALTQRNT